MNRHQIVQYLAVFTMTALATGAMTCETQPVERRDQPGAAVTATQNGEISPAASPASTLLSDSEIAAATFVNLDFDRFPTLPVNEVPAGVVLYVATDGDDGNTGTSTSPLRSIARAVRLAEPGTAVVVRSGEYTEAFENGDHRALLIDKDNLSVMAFPGERVTLQPAEGVNTGLAVTAQNIVVRGIDLEGFTSAGVIFEPGSKRNRHIVLADLGIRGAEEAIAMWEAAGSVDELLLANVETDAMIHCGSGPCSSWRLENVTIDARNLSGWGADAFAVESGDNILLVNVKVLGAGSDGIDTKATRVVVLNCRIEGVENNALKLWHGGDVINTVILRGQENPLVVEEGRFRLLHSAIGFGPEFSGHRDYSAIIGYDKRQPMQIEIINSLIANPSGPMWINPESSAVSIRHSLFFTQDRSEILHHGDAELTASTGLNQHYGAGNLVTDPVLDGDLRPATDSPAVDAGLALPDTTPAHDHEGHERVHGPAPDIGPYEHR